MSVDQSRDTWCSNDMSVDLSHVVVGGPMICP